MKVFYQEVTKNGVIIAFRQYQFTRREIQMIRGSSLPKMPCDYCTRFHTCFTNCAEKDEWLSNVSEYTELGILGIKQDFDIAREKISTASSESEVEDILLSIPPTLRVFARKGTEDEAET